MIWIVIALTLAGVGYFGWRKSQAARRDAKLEAEKRRLKAGLDNPEMDEGFAHQVAIDQAARDKGAV